MDPRYLFRWRSADPYLGSFIILLSLGIITGIVYYSWAQQRQTVMIGIEPAPGGADLAILIAPRPFDGRNRVIDFYNALVDWCGDELTPQPTPSRVT